MIGRLTWILRAKFVTWESEDFESSSRVGLVELFEARELWCEAAIARQWTS